MFVGPSLDTERKRLLVRFEKAAGIRFRRHDLLNLAFIHRSSVQEDGSPVKNNERLEFLGDSVLGLVVAEYLFETLSDRSEGELAKIKSFVVSEDSLAALAMTLGISDLLIIGRGEELSGGRQKKAILADALEAVIAAYYLDAGLKPVREFILRYLTPEVQKVLANKHRRDYKTLLQERVQKDFKTYPRYQLVDKTGPDHEKIFWMEVLVSERCYGPAQGKNKKEAEQGAAELAYRSLFESPDSDVS